PGFEELFEGHRLAWHAPWRRYDIEIDERPQADGPARVQLILRLHIFHLLQTISPNTVGLDVGAPARGLHGEAYRGHVFWDELFILPFYSFRTPAITRSLLLTATTGSGAPGSSPDRRGTPAPCTRGRAAATDAKPRSRSISTRSPGAGCRIRATCSAMSTPPSSTTSGAITRRPATASSCSTTVPRWCSRSPASGRASPAGTRNAAVTRSPASWVPTSTTRGRPVPRPLAWRTTATRTAWPGGACSDRSTCE